MVCDLDGFKAVNDRLGHAAGDQVLRRTAAVLRGQTRTTDLVARNGGDEFAVILVGASLPSARRKGQALTTHIPAAAGEAIAGERIEIGVSFGYAAFLGDESEDDLLAAADLAMYEEKRRKRAAR
jgi:diguanylate cyclase (GGDEF)-like protein